MFKKILSIVILVAILTTSICAFAENEPASNAETATAEAQGEAAAEEKATSAAPAKAEYVPMKNLMEQSGMSTKDDGKKHPVNVASASFDAKTGLVTFTVANSSSKSYKAAYIIECDENSVFQVVDMQQYQTSGNTTAGEDRMCSSMSQLTIAAGEKVAVQEKVVVKGKKAPKFNIFVRYAPEEAVVSNYEILESGDMGDGYFYVEDITNPKNLKAAGSGSAVFDKIGAYLLDNILAIIALLLSVVLLIKTFCKAPAKSEAVVEAVAEENESEDVELAEESSDSETEDAAQEVSEETTESEKEETEE